MFSVRKTKESILQHCEEVLYKGQDPLSLLFLENKNIESLNFSYNGFADGSRHWKDPKTWHLHSEWVLFETVNNSDVFCRCIRLCCRFLVLMLQRQQNLTSLCVR